MPNKLMAIRSWTLLAVFGCLSACWAGFSQHYRDGEAAGDAFGSCVAIAGDVDGDGAADVAIGAPGVDLATGPDGGKVYVFSGATGRLVWSSVEPKVVPNSRFGASIASAGDLDGDARADLVIGAPGFMDKGRVYVAYARGGFIGYAAPDDESLFGRSVASGGDVDGDGLNDVLVMGLRAAYALSGAHGGLIWRWPFVSASEIGAVADAGDLDGDGRSDVVVGHPAPPGGAITAYSGATGLVLWTAQGEGWWDGLGHSLSVGDLDGDGFQEVVAGGPWASGGGKVTAFDRNGNFLRSWRGDGGSDSFGMSLAIGDIEGDGHRELFVGSPSASVSQQDYTGKVFVYAGETGRLRGVIRGEVSHDSYGASVAAQETFFLVGAPGRDATGLNSGRVYGYLVR